MRTLVITEHNNTQLDLQTLGVVNCAAQIGAVDVLIVGSQCQAVADHSAKISGITNVLVCDDPLYANPLAETLSALLYELADNYDAVLAPSTTFGKNLMPRLAVLLDVQQISDVCAVIDHHTFKRPIYAGNAIETVRSRDDKLIITVRTTAFQATPVGETKEAPIQTIKAVPVTTPTTFVCDDLDASDRPELSSASIIVSGGRGLGCAENFSLVQALADQLGGAVGASRAAVDAGYISNDHQVGQTGKIVAPKLYIAVGLSGAIQHLAGMKDSHIIVAINCDPDAPIFKVADYGLVADLFKAIPELAQALKQ